MADAPRRKLIEVALPLEAINRESAREKSIRHGHPSTLHLWWARRPLAAARAVLFAQLVDDPSSHPDKFPTEEAQRAERARLHEIIERLVKWENIRDEALFAEAKAEIMASCDGNPPPILDPFAGGGTIPLEAQRLGLEAHASDLNPVAVLINKALIEIPPKFREQPPVFPGLAESEIREWKGAEGLAADVRAYGQWMRDEAEKRIGHLYPKATLPDGSKATVIAWIWARTVTCPNPACGIEMPLVRSWWLGKRKGKEAFLLPSVEPDSSHPSGFAVSFEVSHDLSQAPAPDVDGTIGRRGATCLACSAAVPLKYIRERGRSGELSARLMCVVAEGSRQRVYLDPTDEHVEAADVARPTDTVIGSVGYYPRDLKVVTYGLTEFEELFSPRQLVALGEFAKLASKARERALVDGAEPDYATALMTYLAIGVSRAVDRSSTLSGWDSSASKIRNAFGRQALAMTWDYAESAPFSSSTGNYFSQIEWTAEAVESTPGSGRVDVSQADATSRALDGVLISTDPPYYDNIGYSDLSDFFYVWLRLMLRDVEPSLFGTLLVPKDEELVANPYRHGGAAEAKEFFESGFRSLFARARASALDGFPITVYYAFKQNESVGTSHASTGWETLLEGMIDSGWTVTSTWPMRSELGNRMMASGMNALASSIVLALRPRPADASTTDRRGFLNALHLELPDALRHLQQGGIAPVDLPQAAIGPGMAVFSRYAKVIDSDGSTMSVRSALARINEVLDEVLNEQEGDFDPTTRFAIQWYRQRGYKPGPYGDAESLAQARGAVVSKLERDGVLKARGGVVTLHKPADLPSDYDVLTDDSTGSWEALHHLIRILEVDGIAPAGDFLRDALSRSDGAIEADLVKELGHLLYRVAEKAGSTQDALSFNNVVTSWPDILAVASEKPARWLEAQTEIDFDDIEES